ncbi:Alpha/Beta hydrolase protein [Mycena galericulata]|nr:Alpha/Beta hydrolase protein [Mycena galericulata]
MSTTTKPTIIIIPGSFCPIFAYDDVIADLKSYGYPVYGIELETVGRRDKAPGLYDDAAKVAALASQLADEGKDVVLLPHSYGGMVACEASKGLAKSVREKEGKKGGISRIVFLTAVVGLEGQSLKDVFEGQAEMGYILMEGEYMVHDKEKLAPVLCSDLPPDQQLAMAHKLSSHSAISFVQPVTYAAYKDIPSSYIFCENDKIIPPAMQDKIIAAMESQMGGRSVDRISAKADHGINASQPKLMVEVVRKALGDMA